MIRVLPNRNEREFQTFYIRARSSTDSAQFDWGIRDYSKTNTIMVVTANSGPIMLLAICSTGICGFKHVGRLWSDLPYAFFGKVNFPFTFKYRYKYYNTFVVYGFCTSDINVPTSSKDLKGSTFE